MPTPPSSLTGNPQQQHWRTVGINLAWKEVVHYDVVHPGGVPPLKGMVHPNEVPPLEKMVQLVEKVPLDAVHLEEMVQLVEEVPLDVVLLEEMVQPDEVPPLEELVQLVEKVPLDVVLLEEMVQPDKVPPLEEVVHLNRVLLNMVQSKPALSMPVNSDEVLLEGEVPLNMVHSDKVPPLEEVVQLKEVVRLSEVPLDVVQDKPAQEQLVENKQCKRKLQQMEADSPAVNVIAYMCIIAKLEM